MDQQPKKKLRTQFIIYPQMQFTMIGINFLIFALTSFFIVTQFYSMMNSIAEIGIEANLHETHPFYNFLHLQKEFFLRFLFIGLGFAFIITSIISIYISHKMAGPIVRMKNYLVEVEKSKVVTPLHFRNDDYFKELAPMLVNTLNSIKNFKN